MKLYRATGLLDLSLVEQTKIVFLGLGSLGSLTVPNLAYPWRQIVLVDPDELEEANIERHLLGYSNLGRPKVEGVRDWLVDRGVPKDRIITHQGIAEDVFSEHADTDLVVVAVDRTDSRHNINAWCLEHNIKALYGSVYPKGVGGQVMVIPNPHEVCYHCGEIRMGAYLVSGADGVPDYGLDLAAFREEINSPKAVPSLHTPVQAIACDMGLMALAMLSGLDESQIVIQSFSWEGVLRINGTDSLIALASFISKQQALGLKPCFRLRYQEAGVYNLEAVYARMCLSLERHRNCPVHRSEVFTIDEI